MSPRTLRILSFSFSASLLTLVSACGGGAGDELGPNNNDAAARAVEPFVGVWNLPDDWNNKPNDEAYLLIKAPDAQGVSEATIFDLDDTTEGQEQNCFIRDGFPGTLTQSLTDEIFLEVTAYPSATVSLLDNGDLEIRVFSEAAGTGVPPDRVLVATQLGITENEITLCEI